MGFSVINLSQFSFFACRVKILHFCPETILISDRKLHSGFLPCFHHLLCLFRTMRHWFFTVHMLLCFKRRDRNFTVRNIRCTNMYDFHFLICKKFFIIRIHSRSVSAILLCRFLRAFLNDIAECDHLVQILIVL